MKLVQSGSREGKEHDYACKKDPERRLAEISDLADLIAVRQNMLGIKERAER